MSNHIIFLSKLIKSVLFGAQIDICDKFDIDWSAVMEVAEQQALIGIVAESIANLPSCVLPPQTILNKLQNFTFNNISRHALFNSTIADIYSTFEKYSIPIVLLKGQALAVEYPYPEMRSCGDIDIYVGIKNYDNAVSLAKENWEDGKEELDENVLHFTCYHNGLLIEIHRLASIIYSPKRNKYLQNWITENLELGTLPNIDLDSKSVPIPTASFNAVYLFLHAWRHYLDIGIGLRQICDWALLLHNHHAEIDETKLHSTLKNLGLLKAWQAMGWIAVHYIGLPKEEMPFYKSSAKAEANKVLHKIMRDGNFGKNSPYHNLSQRNYSNTKRRYLRIKHIAVRFFETVSLDPNESFCILKLNLTEAFNNISNRQQKN